MRSLLNLASDIPGLLRATLLFNANTISKETVSLLWLKDGDAEAMIDLSGGIANVDEPGLTTPMKSYLSGLAEVGQYLKSRNTVDEDGVSADDIERAAITLAFPKVAQDKAALDMIKSHLDALQEHEVIDKLSFSAGAAAATPTAAPKPADQAQANAAPAQPAKAQGTTKADEAAKAEQAQRAERAARREARRKEDEARKPAEAKPAEPKQPAPERAAADPMVLKKEAEAPAPKPAETRAPEAAKPAPADPAPASEAPAKPRPASAEPSDDAAEAVPAALQERAEAQKKRGLFRR